MKRFIILLIALPLGGCFETLTGSVAGSCKVFERPPYAVLGKTAYDQNVADNFVESGVAGCNWRRPAARPASLDARPGQKVAIASKRRSLIKRIKDRVAAPFSAPVAPVVVSSPPIATAPAPPPKPRDPVDELLHPGAR